MGRYNNNQVYYFYSMGRCNRNNQLDDYYEVCGQCDPSLAHLGEGSSVGPGQRDARCASAASSCTADSGSETHMYALVTTDLKYTQAQLFKCVFLFLFHNTVCLFVLI